MKSESESLDRDPGAGRTSGAPRWERRRDFRLILETAALVLLLATPALLWRTTPWETGMLRWDEAEYAALGRALWLGDGYERCGRPESLRPPGLPVVLAGSFALAGEASDAVAQRTATGLRVAAENAEWLVSSNYERGQPAWATELLGQALRGGFSDAWITATGGRVTVLVPLAPRRATGETAPDQKERTTGVPPR